MRTVIPLSAQEVEFALACRDFLAERDPSAIEGIEITSETLILPNNEQIWQAFIHHGVARLLRVFQLAIDNRAISIRDTASVIPHLASFNEKITRFWIISRLENIH
jgi:hypothetical protein